MRLISQSMTKLIGVFALLLIGTNTVTAQSDMTQKEMEEIVTQMAADSQGNSGNVQFIFDGVAMTLLSDITYNRMRIIAPIIDIEALNQEHLYATLVSNFHLALDARYAVSDNMLFSVYIHPLKELTQEQIQSAVRQVASLWQTFGTSYTSDALSFGIGAQQGEDI